MSTLHPLPDWGPQGGALGIEEYLSQSNDNTDFLEDDEKFKFIDDLSILEIINLLKVWKSLFAATPNLVIELDTSANWYLKVL